ncbi:ABC transporter permease [Microbacterium sediminis]|uniref:Uncharacterized protein n=1 Tax=Microbacterium sediminis TaxID=904291 RepID=A0A1B9NCK4_9MICO|nr:hypothetical protein [Microbacterium sediminis]OCG74335.1 hypothetical protein A7J15_05720 [Microbacterium sediminis]QBR73698.1 hypothetical protein E3O41_04195 [Microbacterium sediminis]
MTAFAGTGRLLRLALRRDRIRLAVWLAVMLIVWVAFVSELAVLADEGTLADRALILRSPAMIMMTGPGYGLDDYTLGVALVAETTLWVAAALAVLSILEVVRHTRAEEESGRAELLRAAPVGRHAPAAAALLLVVLVQAAIAAGSTAVIVGVGGVALPDTLALTGGLGLVGLVFAGVALAAAQLVEHARTATGLALAVFGAAFALRAIGDAQQSPATGSDETSWLSWLSPIAWVQQTRAFVDLRLWPLGLLVAAAAVALLAAFGLATRRDFGAGIVPSRPGHAHASILLASPLGLAWRAQRIGLMWTALGLGLVWLGSGTVMGSLGDLHDMLQRNPLYAAVLGSDLVNGFFALLVLLAALGATAWGIASIGRLRAEEASGRTEAVLATHVSRARWLGGQLALSAAGAAVLVMSAAALLWLGAEASGAEDLPGAGELLAFGAAFLPATAVALGLAAAAHAWLPRLAWLAWLPVLWGVVVGMFADLFDLPDAVRALSPFWWTPDPLTGTGAADDQVAAAPALWGLSAVAAALAALAFWGFRRRDVPA